MLTFKHTNFHNGSFLTLFSYTETCSLGMKGVWGGIVFNNNNKYCYYCCFIFLFTFCYFGIMYVHIINNVQKTEKDQ